MAQGLRQSECARCLTCIPSWPPEIFLSMPICEQKMLSWIKWTTLVYTFTHIAILNNIFQMVPALKNINNSHCFTKAHLYQNVLNDPLLYHFEECCFYKDYLKLIIIQFFLDCESKTTVKKNHTHKTKTKQQQQKPEPKNRNTKKR